MRMQAKRWTNEYRTTLICIDRYENRVPEGRFYNPHYSEGVRFYGVIDLLVKLDRMLDEMQFPIPYTTVRSFANVPPLEAELMDKEECREGNVATLAVRILFRQNTSWQGSMVWIEGNREESFRSVLEFLFLLDSAASAEADRQ